ncbi:methyltransferase domain-containing protein [Bradyrhizobium sp. CSA112]|uniref:class I SAM-dependent methyltransferase n=1 Tax=Bradyrhizobium sp. CSA112 TaxID=2699170 RepID=UPI0023AFB5B6|nr:class I SAM-dependent methyltransferase [Bradyrhizobium sp. CSA112]MDE5457575.1 methyltransferase domain-containing protein [Bradyrhizobium sp. CSA112]
MTLSALSTLGNFTNSASYYDDRPRYDPRVLDMLSLLIRERFPGPAVADVGAGTGLLTRELAARGFAGTAIEPNDVMREEGIRHSDLNFPFRWLKGSGEATGLAGQSADWLLMGNAFHWTDIENALREFRRVLRPGGFFTPIWVMLDTDRDATLQSVDRLLADAIPSFSRHSDVVLHFINSLSTGMSDFSDHRVFLDSHHSEVMSKERYLNMWRSRNDLQSALNPREWEIVIKKVEELLVEEEVVLKLRTYAWVFGQETLH